jgi:hypothetical protein
MVSSSLLIAANKNERRAKELLMKLWSRIGGRVAHSLKEKGSQCVCARLREESGGGGKIAAAALGAPEIATPKFGKYQLCVRLRTPFDVHMLI